MSEAPVGRHPWEVVDDERTDGQSVDPFADRLDDSGSRPRRPARPPLDALAVTAFVLALVTLWPVAIVLGHLAHHRLRSGARGGAGLALAALVLGYAGLVLGLLGGTVYFAVLAPILTLP